MKSYDTLVLHECNARPSYKSIQCPFLDCSFHIDLLSLLLIHSHRSRHNAIQQYITRRLFHTKDTPPREVTHRRGLAASRSNSLSPCRSPNTTLQPDGTPYSKTGPPPPRRPVILSPDKHQMLVDRLAYEYKDNDIKREIAM